MLFQEQVHDGSGLLTSHVWHAVHFQPPSATHPWGQQWNSWHPFEIQPWVILAADTKCGPHHDTTGLLCLPVDKPTGQGVPSQLTPCHVSYGHHWYRLSIHLQVSGSPLSSHAFIPWKVPGHSHSSASQHIPRLYRACNSLHARSTGMLNICFSHSATAMASCPYWQIKRHSCTLLPSWLMLKASSMGLSSATYMGCMHSTSTWACQMHSKGP